MTNTQKDFLMFIANELNADESEERSPERNLLAAVVARAICDAFGTAQIGEYESRRARYWIFANVPATKPFSFPWTAVNLGLDPMEIRRFLLETPREEIISKISILKS